MTINQLINKINEQSELIQEIYKTSLAPAIMVLIILILLIIRIIYVQYIKFKRRRRRQDVKKRLKYIELYTVPF